MKIDVEKGDYGYLCYENGEIVDVVAKAVKDGISAIFIRSADTDTGEVNCVYFDQGVEKKKTYEFRPPLRFVRYGSTETWRDRPPLI